jgi:7-carboxy-7-deazaguanine synthase
LRIAEIYKSVQGEGFLTGVESVFVRASGCNLRCWFCDTPYASWNPEGEDLSVDDIAERADAYACEHVVVTGGEPMLFAELIPLCERLRGAGHHITIETAGTLFLPVACDLMSISPKLSNSTPPADVAPRWSERHERTRYAPDVLNRLMDDYAYQLKFVIDTPGDCDEMRACLRDLRGVQRDRVMLMPQGTSLDELHGKDSWLEPYCRRHGFRYCPRSHIEWFGLQRGT